MWNIRVPLSILGAFVVISTALAQIQPSGVTIELQPVATGLVAPVTATHAGDGSGRLFIVDQVGQIRILADGLLRSDPFLDLTDRIVEVNPFFDERGVLGLAFHPDYEDNGRFFVRYSAPREGDPDEPCNQPGFIVGCHSAVLAEFRVSANDPNIADPAGTVLFQVDEPQFNHNAGHVAFGPDGLLYFSLGDGGGAHDGLADVPISHGPIGHGQNKFTALGSILRIDVDHGSPFAVPPGNPFVGEGGVDEIYAYGLRNPYRFSFDDDDEDGDDDEDEDGSRLFLADVGQNLFEEVNLIENGGNFGWVIREGFHCFDPFNPTQPPAVCDTTGPDGEPLVDPVAEYDHDEGIAVIGGFVYRGSLSPELFGKYIFGDFVARLFFIEADGTAPSQIFEFAIGPNSAPLDPFLLGFGRNEAGELFVLTSESAGPSGESGKVLRIVGRSGDSGGDDEGSDDPRASRRVLETAGGSAIREIEPAGPGRDASGRRSGSRGRRQN